jgi:hypothetical protein
MLLIETQWSMSINSPSLVNAGIIPDTNTAISIVVDGCKRSNCHHNFEQMMSSIRETIRTLDKSKYENTLKLYAILSQYEKAVIDPSGSYLSYTNSKRSYQEDFIRTMSLAKLEW